MKLNLMLLIFYYKIIKNNLICICLLDKVFINK